MAGELVRIETAHQRGFKRGDIPRLDLGEQWVWREAAGAAGDDRDAGGKGKQGKAGFVFDPGGDDERGAIFEFGWWSLAVRNSLQRIAPAFAGAAENEQLATGFAQGLGQLVNAFPSQGGGGEKPTHVVRGRAGSGNLLRYFPIQQTCT